MQVITIEAETFKAMQGMVSTILDVVTAQAEELKNQSGNRYMSAKEVCAYTGFGTAWLNTHKEEIGYTQIGSKDLRFKKADVDAYFLKHKIQKKSK